jgi:hypothetical protein
MIFSYFILFSRIQLQFNATALQGYMPSTVNIQFLQTTFSLKHLTFIKKIQVLLFRMPHGVRNTRFSSEITNKNGPEQ